MITTCAPVLALMAFVPLGFAWRLTPLTIDQHPCKPEKLKAQNRYICDSNGEIQCLTGWKDKDYNNDPHFPCAEPICNPTCKNGECKLPNVCVCEIGWDGLDCGTCIDMPGCVNGACNGEPLTCNCDEHWQGALCDTPKCTDDCNNNGICVDTAGEEHECKCNLGWGGDTCDTCTHLSGCKVEHTIDVDPDQDNGPDGCKVIIDTDEDGSGDEVVDIPNSCQCTEHWTGIFCEQPRCLAEDGKTEITCVNGFCKYVEGVDAAFCHCNVGWEGEKCDQCTPQYGCPHPDDMVALGWKIAACIQPNDCRCEGQPGDVSEATKKCKEWIAAGKCGNTADCDSNQICKVDPENPLDGTCVECLVNADCESDVCDNGSCDNTN